MDAGLAVVVGATIAATPATLAWLSTRKTNRKLATNHGKEIGQHVEDQGEKIDLMLQWANFHQEADNEVREALGLESASFPLVVPHDDRLDV